MATQIYMNIPVKDLEKSKEFFSKLGFSFNPVFTDENAACLIIDEGHIYYMLLTHESFKRFTNKTIIDPVTAIDAIHGISTDSREKVDQIYNAAISAGATEARPTDDYGRMYSRSFYDLDGHLWEFLHIDENAAPKADQHQAA